jgi:hypothetical protein
LLRSRPGPSPRTRTVTRAGPASLTSSTGPSARTKGSPARIHTHGIGRPHRSVALSNPGPLWHEQGLPTDLKICLPLCSRRRFPATARNPVSRARSSSVSSARQPRRAPTPRPGVRDVPAGFPRSRVREQGLLDGLAQGPGDIRHPDGMADAGLSSSGSSPGRWLHGSRIAPSSAM